MYLVITSRSKCRYKVNTGCTGFSILNFMQLVLLWQNIMYFPGNAEMVNCSF
jgi:hypothetical protein